jgi:hypothetical protein
MNYATNILALALAFGTSLLSIGCSDQEFVANSGARNGANLSDDKDKGGEDGNDAGGDEEGDSGKDGGIDSDDDSSDDDESSSDSDECRFFDGDHKEKVDGGPNLELGLSDLQDGRWEGDDYVFSLSTYSVADGDTYNAHGGDLHDVLTQAGAADTMAYTQHGSKLPKGHVQLTPISIHELYGLGPAPTGGVDLKSLPGMADSLVCRSGGCDAPYPYFDVKRQYEGVISNAKSKSCEMELTETVEPFLHRSGGGCFALTTNIRLADGRDRYVALLNVGDMVLNPVTGKAARITSITSGPETEQMIRVGYGAYDVRVTQKHPMQTAAGLKQARNLTKADRVLGADGQYHAVGTLEWMPIDSKQVVRNLVINPDSTDPRDHMLLADGVVTGDLYLQRQLEQQAVTAPSRIAKGLTMVAAY